MIELETGRNLFQIPYYRTENNNWFRDFNESILHSNNQLSWDLTAFLSFFSFGYVCGERTLIKEISRNPWLSRINNGEIIYEDIPAHNNFWYSTREIAENLKLLLANELKKVCEGQNNIYVLLSGGLDSRIIAAILSELYRKREIVVKPIAVTWGLPDSRDVVYGSETAKILNLEWIHIDLNQEILYENIFLTANDLGCMVSPIHLHGMSWFKNVPGDSLVINGSYGDSVGRAEFSGRHVLEITHHFPTNEKLLMQYSYKSESDKWFTEDTYRLHSRSMDRRPYVLKELEMQAEYMRGMIGQAMTLIEKYCNVYHAFTDPKVYSYMWSIHPSNRGDASYFELLKSFDQRLCAIPWARTNKNLWGGVRSGTKNLSKEYHQYNNWIRNDLNDYLNLQVDIDWLSEIRFLDINSINNLKNRIKKNIGDSRDADLLIWLASFHIFYDKLVSIGKKINAPVTLKVSLEERPYNSRITGGKIKGSLTRKKIYIDYLKPLRLKLLKMKAKLEYPPIYLP